MGAEDDKVSVTSEEFNDYLDKMSGGRQADFDDEAIDFAGGLEEENERKRKADNDADDDDLGDDGEGGNMENDLVDNEDEEDEPVLEGENEEGFKELESDGEDSDGDFDEEGFGGEDSDGLDEEGFGEDEEDDEQIMGSSSKQLPDKSLSKQGKQKKTKFPRFDPNNLDSILADAEQFSHLIEENDDDAGFTSSVSNSDKAGMKQLAWERKRENGEGGSKGFKGKKKGGPGKVFKGAQSKGGKTKSMPSKSAAKRRKKK